MDNPSGIFLCSGVTWGDDGSELSLTGRTGTGGSLPLEADVRLGFRIISGPGKRYCLGHSKVFGPAAREHFTCLDHSIAERGYQCGPCFAQDDFRFMHDIHRSGIAPDGLKKYLDQPHWLYVATFGNGATKIGTASDPRKWFRLAEQGAVVARYVAAARDGRIVRVLEDAVTADVGLQQAVRSTAKVAGLVSSRPLRDLDAVNGDAAATVRAMLASSVDLDGFEVIDEQWEAPPAVGFVVESPGLQAYPTVDGGEHGFLIQAMVGSTAMVRLDDAETDFLVDLSALKGLLIEPGDFRSTVPDVQELLF